MGIFSRILKEAEGTSVMKTENLTAGSSIGNGAVSPPVQL